MTYDTLSWIGSSLIQHGKMNDRVYLMKYKPDHATDVPGKIEALVAEHGYTKVFAKVAAKYAALFHEHGYVPEATLPDYFPDGDTCLFLAKYFDDKRACQTHADRIADIIALCRNPELSKDIKHLAPYILRKADSRDAAALAALYKEVFATYPFPITDPAYIQQTMETNIDYFLIEADSRLIAAASSEKDLDANAVEMTDFATLPDYRRKGLANHLLKAMEADMTSQGLKTAFTIARAVSAGMNLTFAKNDYGFAGTLVNNTYIAGAIESMNVWYKPLP